MPDGALIGVVSHAAHGETRVAATPPTVRQLVGLGYRVLAESGAGSLAGFVSCATFVNENGVSSVMPS